MSTIMAAFIHVMEALFLIGIVGSAIVILMSGVEDIHSILQPEESVGTAELPKV